MLSTVAVEENQIIQEGSRSEYSPEDQRNSQSPNGGVEANFWPSQTMEGEGEGNFHSNDDELQNSFALQPIKDKLQDMPLYSLDEKCIRTVGKKLDIERPVGLGGNYLDLASRLFPEKSNDSLKADLRTRKYPTSYLIQKYCKEKGKQATVVKMVEALYKMRRLDAIQDILNTIENQGSQGDRRKFSHFKASRLLTILKKRLIKEDDSVSGFSVQTTTSSESYCSFDDESIHVVHGGYQPPMKPNYQARVNTLSGIQEKVKQQESSNIVFVVSASDEIQLCVNLVHWLRKKGFDACCIDPVQLECATYASRYVASLQEKAGSVIMVCSPKYKEVVSDENCVNVNVHDLAVRSVYYDMCTDIFESSGYSKKYIPLVKSPEFRCCVIKPLSKTMATIFEQDDKEKREALLRRLSKVERYTLGPIGSKPKIKPKLITGHISDFRK